MIKLADLMGPEKLRLEAAAMGMQPPRGGGQTMQNDQSDFDQQQQEDPQRTDPDLQAAPYVKLLTKLGYEFMGHDEDVQGSKIGSSFQGPDGDMIIVKPDGSWKRMGPGAQSSSGKDVPSLGQALVRDSLQQGDDENHHSALKQAGYQKIHSDSQGNSYYKHPQTGNSVTVGKDGRWGSSIGTGRGAGKLRDFLGNESIENEDPQIQKIKLQKQQVKQQGSMAKQQTKQLSSGTRGNMGTRGGGGMQPRPRMGGI